ncbi:MAG: CBS domain-containing protein [Clostridiaceae bacterium]|nr:CBS domain-containing protein [Clostridiaceae bacterium]
MYVNNLMVSKDELVTATREDSVQFALDLIEKNDFLSIPVVEKSKFYGVITKELIFRYFYKLSNEKNQIISLSDFKVREIMTTGLPVIHLNDLVETAANLLYLNKSVFVAVLDEGGEFKGIITHTNIFKEFTSLFGLEKGKRIAVTAYDTPGQILKLTKIISENKGDIISCVVEDPRSKLAVKEIVIRVETNNFEHIVHKIENAGFKVNS